MRVLPLLSHETDFVHVLPLLSHEADLMRVGAGLPANRSGLFAGKPAPTLQRTGLVYSRACSQGSFSAQAPHLQRAPALQ